MPDQDDSITPDDQPAAFVQEGDVGQAADNPTAEAVSGGLTWTPYALYLTSWVALSAACVYLLRSATEDLPARWMPEYPVLLWTGVALTAAGPVVSLVTWLVARSRRVADARRGLLALSVLRGALMTVVGAAVWLGTLYVIDVITVNGVLR